MRFGDHDLWVDEEGKLKDLTYGFLAGPDPYHGNGLILSSDEDGWERRGADRDRLRPQNREILGRRVSSISPTVIVTRANAIYLVQLTIPKMC